MKKALAIALPLAALAVAGLLCSAVFLAPRIGPLLAKLSLQARGKYPPLLGVRYPEDARPTEKQKQWVLATCAVLTERNGGCHELLGGKTNRGDIAEMLVRDWGIRSREDLRDALRGLECGGHRRAYDQWVSYLDKMPSEQRGQARRHIASQGGSSSNRLAVVLTTREKFQGSGLAGWDFSRYVALCGWGALVGYLSEAEAWQLAMPAARLLQNTFSSWQELADNYVEGRRFWSLRATLRGDEAIRQAADRLLWKPYSPWVRLKWDTSLLPAQQQDDGSAEFHEGLMWFDGFGTYKRDRAADWAEAAKRFRKAADKGNVDAMYWLGLCYGWGSGVETNEAEACAWYQKAADRGDGPAQYELAMKHYWGLGVKKDKRRVAGLMAQAVTNGCGPKAEAFLGWCYEEGYGVGTNLTEAVRLYQLAADKGEPWAQANLGDCYTRGAGVERSLFWAAKWYKRSAAGGNKDGMCSWAECQEKGAGTLKNEAEALEWYRKAAKAGSGKAKKRLAELERPAAEH